MKSLKRIHVSRCDLKLLLNIIKLQIYCSDNVLMQFNTGGRFIWVVIRSPIIGLSVLLYCGRVGALGRPTCISIEWHWQRKQTRIRDGSIQNCVLDCGYLSALKTAHPARWSHDAAVTWIRLDENDLVGLVTSGSGAVDVNKAELHVILAGFVDVNE